MKISLTLFVVVSLLLGSIPHTLAVNSQDNHFDRSSWPLRNKVEHEIFSTCSKWPEGIRTLKMDVEEVSDLSN